MKESKRKKLAKKSFEELTSSGVFISKLRDIFMMHDYSDKEVIRAFKDAAKYVRKSTTEQWIFSNSKKDKQENEFDDEEFNKPKLNANDKTKIVKKGRASTILDNIDSLLG